LRSVLDGDDFGVSSRTLQFFPAIITSPDNLVIVNYNSADGDFSYFARLARLFQSELHE
jgi:hypothetical protein